MYLGRHFVPREVIWLPLEADMFTAEGAIGGKRWVRAVRG